MTDNSDVFFIVPARTPEEIEGKIRELNALGYPFIIVCGEETDVPSIVYREKRGKYDTINCGAGFLRQENENRLLK